MNTIHAAAALIREIDSPLASLFISRPFHRRAIISALFDSMRRSDPEGSAYRVRVVLTRAVDAHDAEISAAAEAQL